MRETPTCMICDSAEQRPAYARDRSGFVCGCCKANHPDLLDDDDGRSEERHLTILAIDVDG